MPLPARLAAGVCTAWARPAGRAYALRPSPSHFGRAAGRYSV